MPLPVAEMASTIPTETGNRPRDSTASRALVVAGYLVSAAIFVGLVMLHIALFLLSEGGYLILRFEPGVLASWPPSTPKILAFVAAVFIDLAIAVSVGASWFVGLSREDGAEAMKRGLYLFASLSFATWLFTSALISQWIRYYRHLLWRCPVEARFNHRGPFLRRTSMDYQATLDHLYRLERFGIKLGLENIRKLLSLLGDPHRGLKVLHVTGTNGKGSVCAYAASVLQKAGYRVGLYTSPHLIRFNERIRVDGMPIADEDVLRLWSGMQPAVQAMTSARAIDHPTFFEVTTAMAFEYFRERQVDVAAVEVGMGGRMDATNVVDGLVSVVTRVDLEHTEHLGKSVGRIAREKAGIIKPGSRAVTVAQEALHVIEARCREAHAPLTVVGREVRAERRSQDLHGQDVRIRGPFGSLDVRTPLLGSFQVENVAVAVAAVTELRAAGLAVPDEAVRDGIATARWPARFEVVREHPIVLVDGAHNRPAATALANAFAEIFPGRTAILVIGILNDKDLRGIAAALGPLASRVYACRPKTHRAFDAEEVAAAFQSYAETTPVPAVRGAIDAALASARPDDLVLITGSIYTAGEALDHLGVRT